MRRDREGDLNLDSAVRGALAWACGCARTLWWCLCIGARLASFWLYPVPHYSRDARGNACLTRRRVFGAGFAWAVRLARLLAFTAVLAPAWPALVGYYLCSGRVLRGLRYGRERRQTLDIYLPEEGEAGAGGRRHGEESGLPVVVFISGGAWTIGYKAWGALMGKLLTSSSSSSSAAENGQQQQPRLLFVTPDYRNFPQARVPGMVRDVAAAVAWVEAHIGEYGGDARRVHVVGQSAGAHLAVLALLLQARDGDAALGGGEGEGGGGEWSGGGEGAPPQGAVVAAVAAATAGGSGSGEQGSSGSSGRERRHDGGRGHGGGHGSGALLRAAAVVAISGPHDLVDLLPHFSQRGLAEPVVRAVFSQGQPEGEAIASAFVAARGRGGCGGGGGGVSGGGGGGERRSGGAAHDDAAAAGDDDDADNAVLLALSPTCVAASLSRGAARRLARGPRIVLLHGTADETVPARSSVALHAALQRLSAVVAESGGGGGGSRKLDVSLKLYGGLSHTDPIIECPLGGGPDQLTADLLAVVSSSSPSAAAAADAPAPPPMCSPPLAAPVLIWLARQLNPF